MQTNSAHSQLARKTLKVTRRYDTRVARTQGSEHAMCEHFWNSSPKRHCFPALAFHIRRQNHSRYRLCVPPVCTFRPLRDLRSLF